MPDPSAALTPEPAAAPPDALALTHEPAAAPTGASGPDGIGTTPVQRRGIVLGRRSLREHATRGVLVTGIWMAAMGLVQAARNLVLPGVLGPEEYGLWGAILVFGALLAALRTTGAGEIFVGQDDDDQELAFRRVFAVEVGVNGALTLLTLASAPLLALLYDDPRLLPLGLVTALAWPAQTLQAPLWVLSRRMAFGRLRLVQSIDPLLGAVVAVALALLGLGVWAIVLGILVGAWATALVAVVLCPYPLRPRFDRDALRRYGRISAPLWLAAVAGALVALGTMVLARRAIDPAAVGAVTLASSITFFATRLDQAVSTVLYPAIAAAKERPDVLGETFAKANRVGLAWAVPVAAALVLFAPQLVPALYGDRWPFAVGTVQWFAVSMAIAHLGTNWWQYELVAGRTRPLAVNGLVALALFVLVQVPAILLFGLEGLAVSMVAQAVGQLAVRTVYVRRRFGTFSPLRLAARSLLPVLPPVAVGLVLLRLDVPLGVELAAFAAVLAGSTLALERPLVREIAGYLRGAVR